MLFSDVFFTMAVVRHQRTPARSGFRLKRVRASAKRRYESLVLTGGGFDELSQCQRFLFGLTHTLP